MNKPKGQLVFEYRLYNRFESYFNSLMPKVLIGEYIYSPASSLKLIYPIAYKQEFLSWLRIQLRNQWLKEYEGNYYENTNF